MTKFINMILAFWMACVGTQGLSLFGSITGAVSSAAGAVSGAVLGSSSSSVTAVLDSATAGHNVDDAQLAKIEAALNGLSVSSDGRFSPSSHHNTLTKTGTTVEDTSYILHIRNGEFIGVAQQYKGFYNVGSNYNSLTFTVQSKKGGVIWGVAYGANAINRDDVAKTHHPASECLKMAHMYNVMKDQFDFLMVFKRESLGAQGFSYAHDATADSHYLVVSSTNSNYDRNYKCILRPKDS